MCVTNVDLPEFTDFKIKTYIIPAVSKKFANDRNITVELVSKQRPSSGSSWKYLEFKFSFTRNGITTNQTRSLRFKV